LLGLGWILLGLAEFGIGLDNAPRDGGCFIVDGGEGEARFRLGMAIFPAPGKL